MEGIEYLNNTTTSVLNEVQTCSEPSSGISSVTFAMVFRELNPS